MRKKFFCLSAVCLAILVSFSGCNGILPKEQGQEVDYRMSFANRTGQSVTKLEIRPSEEADWSEITLTEKEWKNGYEMPVILQGVLPEAENGWQVQMTFPDEKQMIWEGVAFGADATYTFTLENNTPAVIVMNEQTAEEPTGDEPRELEEQPSEE